MRVRLETKGPKQTRAGGRTAVACVMPPAREGTDHTGIRPYPPDAMVAGIHNIERARSSGDDSLRVPHQCVHRLSAISAKTETGPGDGRGHSTGGNAADTTAGALCNEEIPSLIERHPSRLTELRRGSLSAIPREAGAAVAGDRGDHTVLDHAYSVIAGVDDEQGALIDRARPAESKTDRRA